MRIALKRQFEKYISDILHQIICMNCTRQRNFQLPAPCSVLSLGQESRLHYAAPEIAPTLPFRSHRKSHGQEVATDENCRSLSPNETKIARSRASGHPFGPPEHEGRPRLWINFESFNNWKMWNCLPARDRETKICYFFLMK